MNTRPLAILSALAVANALYSHAIAEETLGRLFFTPEKRQALDHQRQFNIQQEQTAPENPTFTIDGVVTRSSGKKTVWINGVAAEENDTSSDISVAPERNNPGRVLIQTGESSATPAKVGETVRRDTGDTADLLNGGHIVVRRARP